MTNSISNVATATHTAIATGTVQLVCTGDSDALTTYEQANADGTPLTFVVTNQCDYSIWPEVSYREWPNSTDVTDFNIGELADGASYTWSAHPYWMTSARMWAKEGCDSSGENCVVDAGNAPTLFEFNIYPDASTCQAEIDYDISLGKPLTQYRRILLTCTQSMAIPFLSLLLSTRQIATVAHARQTRP